VINASSDYRSYKILAGTEQRRFSLRRYSARAAVDDAEGITPLSGRVTNQGLPSAAASTSSAKETPGGRTGQSAGRGLRHAQRQERNRGEQTNVKLEARCAKSDANAKDADCETLKGERDKWETQRKDGHAIISTRLAGETAMLADRITAAAMTPHPALDKEVRGGTRTLSQVVEQRITSATVLDTLERWLQDVLDSEGRAMAVRYIDPLPQESQKAVDHQKAVLHKIAEALVQPEDPIRLVAVVERATRSAFNSYNLGSEAAAWGKDIAGRVTWATAALVFCFALVLLIAASVVQMLRIAPPGGVLFIVATVLVASITVWASFEVDSWLRARNIPLLKLLTDYSLMFDVKMWAWATSLNALAAVGAVSLIAGTVATFSVGIKTDPTEEAKREEEANQVVSNAKLPPDELKAAQQLTDEKLKEERKEELKEQLQGLRMLFNAGSVCSSWPYWKSRHFFAGPPSSSPLPTPRPPCRAPPRRRRPRSARCFLSSCCRRTFQRRAYRGDRHRQSEYPPKTSTRFFARRGLPILQHNKQEGSDKLSCLSSQAWWRPCWREPPLARV
jgi:hypothetical protein